MMDSKRPLPEKAGPPGSRRPPGEDEFGIGPGLRKLFGIEPLPSEWLDLLTRLDAPSSDS
jgi:hypothetical protein